MDLEGAIPQIERRGGVHTSAPRWIPPPRGIMKVNVDAAISKNSCIATMATIARDEGGSFHGALVLVTEGVSSPEMAEAMAYREGLALAKDLALQKVRIATGCGNVVRSIQGPGMGPYGHITREIKRQGWQASRKQKSSITAGSQTEKLIVWLRVQFII